MLPKFLLRELYYQDSVEPQTFLLTSPPVSSLGQPFSPFCSGASMIVEKSTPIPSAPARKTFNSSLIFFNMVKNISVLSFARIVLCLLSLISFYCVSVPWMSFLEGFQACLALSTLFRDPLSFSFLCSWPTWLTSAYPSGLC